MAYNLHIFRGTDWTDGADDPITADELLSIDGVEKFSQPPITNPRTGLSMSMGMNNMYSFGKAVFMLEDGMITVACRNEDVPDVMRPLAEALGAVIQGDEEEYY
ncbi:MAG: hypothetical protein J6U00_14440 [Ruminococcus sp.]|uniref:hypothetical protein n=1 Tax=Ruminococcus sp. TaxID=41978 RepID=UPI001B1D34CA|nr:hypothetical protein [Ruminococcus sp.]MBO7475171.1 hypothetical protein [Ruminococcus sp.]MBP5431819.1 hypothetical protein [Ruminococcus sp.]